MNDSHKPLLFVAHPGHELMLYGWMKRARPRVCVLTDGSGKGASSSRVASTAALLDAVGATKGSIFSPMSDRAAYDALLGGDVDLFVDVADALAGEIAGRAFVVGDPAEGYNPVHDVCRWIVGAACEVAGVAHREYPLIAHPSPGEELEAIELDEVTFAEKLAHGRSVEALRDDVEWLVTQFGERVVQRETLTRVAAWDADLFALEPPEYEQIGAQRVAAGHYTTVIRYAEHMLPIRDGLRQWARAHACVSTRA